MIGGVEGINKGVSSHCIRTRKAGSRVGCLRGEGPQPRAVHRGSVTPVLRLGEDEVTVVIEVLAALVSEGGQGADRGAHERIRWIRRRGVRDVRRAFRPDRLIQLVHKIVIPDTPGVGYRDRVSHVVVGVAPFDVGFGGVGVVVVEGRRRLVRPGLVEVGSGGVLDRLLSVPAGDCIKRSSISRTGGRGCIPIWVVFGEVGARSDVPLW